MSLQGASFYERTRVEFFYHAHPQVTATRASYVRDRNKAIVTCVVMMVSAVRAVASTDTRWALVATASGLALMPRMEEAKRSHCKWRIAFECDKARIKQIKERIA